MGARGHDAVPPAVLELLARADGELVAAELSGQAWERYLHAHLAALRSAAAVLAFRGQPRGRGLPKDAWSLADRVAPELSRRWAYFRAGARTRSAIDAGRIERVTARQADDAVVCAQSTVEAVRGLIDGVDEAAGSLAS
jgi:hypothetical protein